MKISTVATLAALGMGLSALLASLPASAQQARPPGQIKITNMRSAPLTTFEIATIGEQPRLVGKIAQPLAPGKSIAVKLNKPAGCNYYVLARFDDEAEGNSESMDLCRDRVIRLTD
jgi:hypothetical protein